MPDHTAADDATRSPTAFECGRCGEPRDEGRVPDVLALTTHDAAQPPNYGRLPGGVYRVARWPWLELLAEGWPEAIIPGAVERLGDIPPGGDEYNWGFAYLCGECRATLGTDEGHRS